jgi:hypothetical protein
MPPFSHSIAKKSCHQKDVKKEAPANTIKAKTEVVNKNQAPKIRIASQSLHPKWLVLKAIAVLAEPPSQPPTRSCPLSHTAIGSDQPVATSTVDADNVVR